MIEKDQCNTVKTRGAEVYVCTRENGHPGLHYSPGTGKHFKCHRVWHNTKGKKGEQASAY